MKNLMRVASCFLAATAFADVCWDEASITGHTPGEKCFFAPGEEMAFTLKIEGAKGTLPPGAYFVKWTRTGDDGKTDSGIVPASLTEPFVVRTSSTGPGFVRLEAEVVDRDGKRVPKKHRWEKRIFFGGGAGVRPEALRGWPEPADFDAHWAAEKARLAALPLVVLEKRELPCLNPALRLFAVKVNVPEDYLPMTGYLAVPKAASATNRVSASVFYMGYGNEPQEVTAGDTNAVRGIRLVVNRHGEELGNADPTYRKQFHTCPRILSPAYFRGMVFRDLRALQFVKTLPEWNGRDLSAEGGSGGGMQALWMGALDPDVSYVSADVPCFGNLGGFQLGHLKASFRPAWSEESLYYDICNFAKRIRCRVKIGSAGLGDYVSPPNALALVYNSLKGPKEITWRQGCTHGWRPKGMARVTFRDEGLPVHDGWPLITVRHSGSATFATNLLDVVRANARHPGSVDEYWFAYNAGTPPEKLDRALLKMCEYKDEMRAAGITVGAQQGQTLGHSTFVGAPGIFTGNVWQVAATGKLLKRLCPRNPEVLANVEALTERAVRGLGMRSIWLDDDLRLSSGGKETDGCFCDHCVAAFNAEQGTAFSPTGLIARLYSNVPKVPLRRAWRRFKSKSLALYAAAVRRGADRVDPTVRLGYQSINAFDQEAADSFVPLLRELAGPHGKTGIRCGSGCYYEDLVGYYHKSLSVAREAERCRGQDFSVQISYEQETCTREVLHKSAEAVLIESAIAMAAGAEAVTEYWWSPNRDEPVSYYEEFAEMTAAWRPYFERVSAISHNTSLGGLARFRGSEADMARSRHILAADDITFGRFGVPMTMAEARHRIWYVNEQTLNEWGPGDAARLAADGAVVDSAIWDRLLACGGETLRAAAAAGRLVRFDFTLMRVRKKRTLPTHAERQAFLDAVDRVAPMPVRVNRSHPLFVYPRLDQAGCVRAVAIANGSIGRCLPTDVIVRNPVAGDVLWLRPAEKPVRAEVRSRDATSCVVRIPGLPGAHIGTLVFGANP